MADCEQTSFQSVHKSYYKCCKNKEVNIFICVQCFSIFHKSCALRSNKNFSFITENQLICCKKANDDENSTDVSILDSLITDLSKDNKLKENYIQKLKHDNKSFTEEAIQNEEKMSEIIENQQKDITHLKTYIEDLKKQLKNTDNSGKDTKTICTQTDEKGSVDKPQKNSNKMNHNNSEEISKNTGCVNNDKTASIPSNAVRDAVETSYLKELIIQKDIIINKLEDSIISLKEQISLLNTIININSTHTFSPEREQSNKTTNIFQSISKGNSTKLTPPSCSNKTKSSSFNTMTKKQTENSNKLASSKQNGSTSIKFGSTSRNTTGTAHITPQHLATALLEVQTESKINEILEYGNNWEPEIAHDKKLVSTDWNNASLLVKDHQIPNKKTKTIITNTENTETAAIKNLSPNIDNKILLTKENLKHNQKIIGADMNNLDIVAKEKIWLFLSKYKLTYSLEDLQAYLKTKCPEDKFICSQVKNYQGTFNTFKVAVDADIKDAFLNPKMWPNGIEISEYSPRKKQFFRNSISSQPKQQGYQNHQYHRNRKHGQSNRSRVFYATQY